MHMTPENLALILGLTEAITVAVIGGGFKLLSARQERIAKKQASRNKRVAKARDKEQVAFKQQIKAAINLTNDLTIAVQTGQTNGFITQSQERFEKAVEKADKMEIEAKHELESIYSEIV